MVAPFASLDTPRARARRRERAARCGHAATIPRADTSSRARCRAALRSGRARGSALRLSEQRPVWASEVEAVGVELGELVAMLVLARSERLGAARLADAVDGFGGERVHGF